jgi:hypothetical protein
MNRLQAFALTFIISVFPDVVVAKGGVTPRNTTVLIVRHGEKPPNGKDLSADGFKRAQDYVSYFKHLKIDSHPIKIDELYAAGESAHSDRSHETLIPLSEALKLKIRTRFNEDQVDDLAKKLADGTHNGETVVVCWHHGKIPDLLKAFGVDPSKLLPGGNWPEDVFGWLVVLHYDDKGNVSARVQSESLEPNDAKHPPMKQ